MAALGLHSTSPWKGFLSLTLPPLAKAVQGAAHFFEWFFWPVLEVSRGLVGPKGALGSSYGSAFYS